MVSGLYYGPSRVYFGSSKFFLLEVNILDSGAIGDKYILGKTGK